MLEKIINVIDAPTELEKLYQQNSEEFQKAFPNVFAQHPDSLILQVWNERITYISGAAVQRVSEAWSYKNVLFVILLSLIAGTIVELPQYLPKLIGVWLTQRNTLETIIVAIMVYFLFQTTHSKWTATFTLALTIGALLYINLLPKEYLPASVGPSSYYFEQAYKAFYDALILAELYIPVFLLILLGLAFLGKGWREISGRMSFIRYIGELIIYTTILLIGVATLTAITFALLNLVNATSQWTDWYGQYIILYAIVAAPIVGTFLVTKIINKHVNMAPILARIFTPLFLLTSVAYLVIVIIYYKEMYSNRDFLITFNVLLIFILGLSVFSIAERDPTKSSGASDYMNIGLISTNLIIDSIALSATISRMTSLGYGFTPNRIAVLGINVLFFCHLVGILITYIRFLLNKSSFQKLEQWITAYLPAYGIWALINSIALPFIFWYK